MNLRNDFIRYVQHIATKGWIEANKRRCDYDSTDDEDEKHKWFARNTGLQYIWIPEPGETGQSFVNDRWEDGLLPSDRVARFFEDLKSVNCTGACSRAKGFRGRAFECLIRRIFDEYEIKVDAQRKKDGIIYDFWLPMTFKPDVIVSVKTSGKERYKQFKEEGRKIRKQLGTDSVVYHAWVANGRFGTKSLSEARELNEICEVWGSIEESPDRFNHWLDGLKQRSKA